MEPINHRSSSTNNSFAGRRLKVLISVYACEPGKGSEPGVGWNGVKQISRFHDVWVLTRTNNRESIEQAIRDEPMPHVRWIYYDLPVGLKFWKKGGRGVRLYYYLWQMGIYRIAKRIHEIEKFDLVHHLTFVNYWMPSFLAALKAPFVWGPVGGGESAPSSFFDTFSWRGKIYEQAREIRRWLGEHDPFVLSTARKARVTFAVTRETEARIEKIGCKNVQLLSQVALSEHEIKVLEPIQTPGIHSVRFLSVGRMLHWKGFHLGLEAYSQLGYPSTKTEYWLIGEGAELARLKALTRRLNIADRVHFESGFSRELVLKKLSECDVLVHPSLHESGGAVCLEAMAAGKPVICLDLGGPAVQVTPDTGFKIPARNPLQVIRDMAKAMSRLAQDRELCRRMGEAGRKRARECFMWEQKGEIFARAYQTAVSGQ